MNSEAVLRYGQYLELAIEWLANHSGITEESARALQFGVVQDPFPSHSGMVGRLCIPYLDAHGTPQALKFRCLRCAGKCEGHPKYLGLEGAEPRLYNVVSLLDDAATTLWVTEGELDCAVLAQELELSAIGYPGTGSWSDLFTRAVAPQDWERIVVIADHDLNEAQAGQKAAAKVAKALGGEVLLMPPGDDVSSAYVRLGRAGLTRILGLEVEEDEMDGFDPGPEPEYPF